MTKQFFNRTSTYRSLAKQLGIEWSKGWEKPNGFKDLTEITKDIRIAIKAEAVRQMQAADTQIATPKRKYALFLGADRKEQKT